MRYIRLMLLGLVLASTGAHAQSIFDAINKAVGVVRQVQGMQGQAQPGGDNGQWSGQPKGAPVSGYGNELFGLREYPGAKIRKEYANPYDRVFIPISLPKSGKQARYAVQVEGKVWGTQYHHQAGESPLRIDEHYEALLLQQGFEKLFECDAACHRREGVYPQSVWNVAIETRKQFSELFWPADPTVKVFYKPDGIVLTATGTWGNSGDGYASAVYAVQGRILDMQPIEEVKARNANREPATLPAGYRKPAPVSTSGTMPESQGNNNQQATLPAAEPAQPGAVKAEKVAMQSGGGVEEILPKHISANIARTKGLLVMQLTSRDRNCSYCVASNPHFDVLAARKPDAARYVRVSWEPWGSAFAEPFISNYGIGGVPAFLTFRDGRLIQRVDGNTGTDGLEKLFIADETRFRNPVQNISPQEFEKLIAEYNKEKHAGNQYGQAPGFKPSSILVQFSSRDPACPQCLAANDTFDAVAASGGTHGLRLFRVTWEPWQSAASHPIVKRYGFKGLPLVMKFVSGDQRNRLVGEFRQDMLISHMGLGNSGLLVNATGLDSTWMRFAK